MRYITFFATEPGGCPRGTAGVFRWLVEMYSWVPRKAKMSSSIPEYGVRDLKIVKRLNLGEDEKLLHVCLDMALGSSRSMASRRRGGMSLHLIDFS